MRNVSGLRRGGSCSSGNGLLVFHPNLSLSPHTPSLNNLSDYPRVRAAATAADSYIPIYWNMHAVVRKGAKIYCIVAPTLSFSHVKLWCVHCPTPKATAGFWVKHAVCDVINVDKLQVCRLPIRSVEQTVQVVG